MLARVYSGAIIGLQAEMVIVEVDIATKGLPSFTIVGLPDKAVEESKERVRTALRNSGAEFPAKRITVNLAPADLPKFGPSYDLPIAVGILIASGQLPQPKEDSVYVGELSLDGSLRGVNGILAYALMAKNAKKRSLTVPQSNATEAAVVRDIEVVPVKSLLQLYAHIAGTSTIPLEKRRVLSESLFSSGDIDISDIHGQEHVKRALEVAVAGGHNVYMQGPPGSGKTMLARAVASIMPPLTEQEAIEITTIYSVTGNLPERSSLIASRPFRAPHHTTSRNGLIGGGRFPRPGEVSLAHRGVLFLDEFPEFPRSVLEALRQPMEDGVVTVSRAAGSMTFPAKFMLIAAANPCPCGNFGTRVVCSCSTAAVARYQKRVSGPILDRIDIHIHVPAVRTKQLISSRDDKSPLKEIRYRIRCARELQTKRFAESGIITNSEMSTKVIKKYCRLNRASEVFLEKAIDSFSLSARAYFRILRVSRTIADIEQVTDVDIRHVAEALQYRVTDDSAHF